MTGRTVRSEPSEHPAPSARPLLWLIGLLGFAVAAALAQPRWLWPVLIVPIILSVPLGGRAGAIFAAILSAVAWGAVSEQVGVPVGALAVAWLATVGTSTLLGARYRAVSRAYTHMSGQSMRDRLTGLYNYAFFSDTLRRECTRVTRYGGELSLVLFDVDEFKAFNDQHGHAAGNRLLAEVGHVMEATRRGADTVARFGGEEFALLVNGPAEMAREAAERVRVAIARIAIDVGSGEVDGRTISGGVASYVRGDSPDELVKTADRALYLSKRRGRNRISLAGSIEQRRALSA